jgi:hypothetical protein
MMVVLSAFDAKGPAVSSLSPSLPTQFDLHAVDPLKLKSPAVAQVRSWGIDYD